MQLALVKYTQVKRAFTSLELPLPLPDLEKGTPSSDEIFLLGYYCTSWSALPRVQRGLVIPSIHTAGASRVAQSMHKHLQVDHHTREPTTPFTPIHTLDTVSLGLQTAYPPYPDEEWVWISRLRVGQEAGVVQQVNKKRRQWAPLCGGQPRDALLTELLGKPLQAGDELNRIPQLHSHPQDSCTNLVSVSLLTDI